MTSAACNGEKEISTLLDKTVCPPHLDKQQHINAHVQVFSRMSINGHQILSIGYSIPLPSEEYHFTVFATPLDLVRSASNSTHQTPLQQKALILP